MPFTACRCHSSPLSQLAAVSARRCHSSPLSQLAAVSARRCLSSPLSQLAATLIYMIVVIGVVISKSPLVSFNGAVELDSIATV